MKKSLIAVAALASTAAFAQVTMSGSVAFGIQNTIKDSTTRLQLTDADITVSASQDLGGGMKATAAMTIESENMRSNMVNVGSTKAGISGGFGALNYFNGLSCTAKLSAGVSAEDDTCDILGGYANINGFTYTLPTFVKGLTLGMDSYGVGGTGTPETQLDISDSDSRDWFASYTMGPLWVYYEGSNSYNDFRGSYDFGAAKIALRVRDFDAAGVANRQEFALTAPMGAISAGLHWVKQGTTSGYGLSVSYAMSKTASFQFSSVDADNYKAGTMAGASGSNYRFQFKQSF
jgi:hypothetical protein